MTTARYGFTPGPWYATEDKVREHASDAVIALATDGMHADDEVEVFDEDERIANARAIALVPEHVAALEGLVRTTDDYWGGVYCEFCNRHAPTKETETSWSVVGPIPHADDCLLENARALLATLEKES